jgi:hypothetical protein
LLPQKTAAITRVNSVNAAALPFSSVTAKNSIRLPILWDAVRRRPGGSTVGGVYFRLSR